MSEQPCQFKVGYKINSFCNTPYIYILDKDKKPALTFSSDLDGVYAHYADKKTTKIDIDLENYSPIGVKDGNLWLADTSGVGQHGVSVLNLKNKKISQLNPIDCHSVLSSMSSLNDPVPYAYGMECNGKKEIIVFDQKNRDAQLLQQLAASFPDKTVGFGNWTDSNEKAL